MLPQVVVKPAYALPRFVDTPGTYLCLYPLLEPCLTYASGSYTQGGIVEVPGAAGAGRTSGVSEVASNPSVVDDGAGEGDAEGKAA